MSVPAADHVDATLAGAAATLAVAGLGYLGTRRSRPDASAVLVESAVKLAQAASGDNDELRHQVDRLATKVSDLEHEADKLRRGLEACRSQHAAAQQELAEVRKQVAVNTTSREVEHPE